MYEDLTQEQRGQVAQQLRLAKQNLDLVIQRLQDAKQLGAADRYLGYDMDDRLYSTRRLQSDIGAHIDECELVEDLD